MSASKINTTFLDSSFIFFCLERGLKTGQILQSVGSIKNELVTNVKVLQEVVYYYHLLGETQLGYDFSTKIAALIKVNPIGQQDLDELDVLLERYPRLKPRALFHVGSMKRFKVKSVLCDPRSDFREVDDVVVASKLKEMGLLG